MQVSNIRRVRSAAQESSLRRRHAAPCEPPLFGTTSDLGDAHVSPRRHLSLAGGPSPELRSVQYVQARKPKGHKTHHHPALKPVFTPPTLRSSKIPLYTFTMASRPAARALRQTARQLAAPAVQRRTFVSALNTARAGVAAAPKAAVTSSYQQVRGIKTIDFAGTKETVYGRS